MRPIELTFRPSTRIRGFDYRENHAYFVTICTFKRQCVFGSVTDGTVSLSQRGQVVQRCWKDLPTHHPFIELDAFVIMPNHVHAVICIVGNDVEATPASRSPRSGESTLAHGPRARSLSAVIGSFKSAISRNLNRLRAGAATNLWQPNFYEHVVRSDRAMDTIRDYVVTNPLRWTRDIENPDGDGTDSHICFSEQLAALDSRLRRERDACVAPTNTNLAQP